RQEPAMRKIVTLACAFGIVSLSSGVAAASSITVANASFEDLLLADGVFSVGNIPQWSVSTSGDTSTWNPTASTFSNPDGNNVAAAQNNATISQLLGDTLMANSIYQLTVAVGSENGPAGGSSFTIGLYAHDGSGDHLLNALVGGGLVENGVLSDYSV